MSFTARVIMICVVALGLVPAQVVIDTAQYTGSGAGTSHVVRTSGGDLYCLTVTEDASANRPLLLQISSNGGTTWAPLAVALNDATSGLSGATLANQCSLAIDDQDVLHVLWASYTYPSAYRQWYRNYDPATATLSSIVDVATVTGASASSRTAAMQITVDQGNIVWIVAQGGTSWREKLVRSTAAYASGLAFMDVGFISPSASAQNTRIAVDLLGRVHCSYYRNTGPGEYEHRIYDPVTGWQASTNIGNGSTAPHDYFGTLTADALGNVHALIGVDVGTPATTWRFEYRRWDPINLWSSPTTLTTATQAQYAGVANYRIFDLACNEATGKVYAVYRDLAAGGSLRLAEKGLADVAFTNLPDLAPANVGQHYYYQPKIRGTLFPTTNNAVFDVDVTWQLRQVQGSPPYSILFQRVSVGGASDYQLNQPESTATINGQIGTVTTPASSTVPSGGVAQVALSSTLTGANWTLGIAAVPPVPASGGGITLGDGQRVNIDFADPSFYFLFTPPFASPPFSNLTVNLDTSSPFSASFQMGVLDASVPSGVRVSQPNWLVVQ